MEFGKRLSSISEERKLEEKGRKKVRDEKENVKTGWKKKPSLIPVPKSEKCENKDANEKQRKCYSSSRLCCATSKSGKRYEDFEFKLKLLEEKEKSIAMYYQKVEELIQKLGRMSETEKGNSTKPDKTCESASPRKMTSDTLVLTKEKNSDILTNLENNVQQISQIWLQASTDLANTLKNLKNKPTLNANEFELEKVRIQLAIKQTKSLTLIKTRDILAEAKKLFRHRELIRLEMENLLNFDKSQKGQCKCFLKEWSKDNTDEETNTTETETETETESKENTCETDTQKVDEWENQDTKLILSSHEAPIKKLEVSGTEEECLGKGRNRNKDGHPEEKDEKMKKENKSTKRVSPKRISDSDSWQKEMSKKNETIATLNNKIFELQKTCNEKTQKCSKLQAALSQFSDKVQWNQVLWKQIGKLKEQNKCLVQNNKALEAQKRQLEIKVSSLDLELDRLNKLNHFLNQKKNLLNAQEHSGKEHYGDNKAGDDLWKVRGEKFDKELLKTAEEKILAEKQNAINQLKAILSVMKDQENFAQKQISVFQDKIEELERNTKA